MLCICVPYLPVKLRSSVKFFLSLLPSLVFLYYLTNAALLNIAPESVEAAAWTIVDTQSGQIIAEHNSHVQRAPASLTKMMVAYIALKEIKAGKLKKKKSLLQLLWLVLCSGMNHKCILKLVNKFQLISYWQV